jgi:hypothetical protein
MIGRGASVFGSCSGGTESENDILVDFDPAIVVTIF